MIIPQITTNIYTVYSVTYLESVWSGKRTTAPSASNQYYKSPINPFGPLPSVDGYAFGRVAESLQVTNRNEVELGDVSSNWFSTTTYTKYNASEITNRYKENGYRKMTPNDSIAGSIICYNDGTFSFIEYEYATNPGPHIWYVDITSYSNSSFYYETGVNFNDILNDSSFVGIIMIPRNKVKTRKKKFPWVLYKNILY